MKYKSCKFVVGISMYQNKYINFYDCEWNNMLISTT